ncbi:MAG: hypothetical protein KJZ85_06530 [Rhodobacteraceae bacterium]|jgi:hypothetical protein|nr:hypothetical protein [Paracoccaceae bacterium]
MPHVKPAARPWHLWPVALAAVAVFAALAVDYLLVRLGFETHVALVLAGAQADLGAHPLWVAVGWGATVWAGLVGAVMLMAREDGAAVALAFAFLGAVAVSGHVLASLPAPLTLDAVRSEGGALAALAAFSLLVWLYARVQKQRGVLT